MPSLQFPQPGVTSALQSRLNPVSPPPAYQPAARTSESLQSIFAGLEAEYFRSPPKRPPPPRPQRQSPPRSALAQEAAAGPLAVNLLPPTEVPEQYHLYDLPPQKPKPEEEQPFRRRPASAKVRTAGHAAVAARLPTAGSPTVRSASSAALLGGVAMAADASAQQSPQQQVGGGVSSVSVGTRVFPSKKPNSRAEVSHLMRTLDLMLDQAGDNTTEALRAWDVVFSELVRQASVDCIDRGA